MSNFMNSETRINLMRAFAGESQARNRYTFAQEVATQQNLYLISQIFKLTANQEKAHAKVFYDLLKEANGNPVDIDASYPVDVYTDVKDLLRTAICNESDEHENIYPYFAEIAVKEGFEKVASKFRLIAEIEDVHKKRFEYYYQLMTNDKLFKSDKTECWFCLNCGHIHSSSEAPNVCPTCNHNQGFFIRMSEAAYTPEAIICQG